MGFNIWQRDSSFCIRKENFPELVKAAIQRFPDWFDEMSSVREIFKEFDFEVDKDDEGNLDDIVFTGEKAGNEDEFFETIAPFVEAGSSVSFYGEDNSIWQYRFDGKGCHDESPLLIWPENPKALKEGQTAYRLPFSIQGELEFFAGSRNEVCKALEFFDSEDFLSHLLMLFQRNGIKAYLRPEEMKEDRLMRLFDHTESPASLLHAGPLLAKEKLGLFQQFQLKQAAEQKMSPEFIAVIATGYSDVGHIGTRSAREMRRFRQLLASYRMRFSCISLLALSDESILLYACGFERSLPLWDIRLVVSWYNEEVRNIQAYHTWMSRRERKQRIVKAYHDSVKRLSHFVSAVA